MPAIDIVIISYNSSRFNLECIASIYDTAKDIIGDIIVVDNASDDDSVQAIRNKYPEVMVIQNSINLGYARAVNIGVEASKADKVIITNSDVIFLNDSIKELAEGLDKSIDLAVCGPQQLFPDKKLQDSFGEFPGVFAGLKDMLFLQWFGSILRRAKYKLTPKMRFNKDVDYIDGAVMAVKKEAFNDVKGFDEDYFFYTEEADFCYRLKKNGWIILHLPQTYVIHYRGGSTEGKGMSPRAIKMLIESKRLFAKKHLNPVSRKIYYISELAYFSILGLIRKLQGNKKLIDTLQNFRNEWRKALKEE